MNSRSYKRKEILLFEDVDKDILEYLESNKIQNFSEFARTAMRLLIQQSDNDVVEYVDELHMRNMIYEEVTRALNLKQNNNTFRQINDSVNNNLKNKLPKIGKKI